MHIVSPAPNAARPIQPMPGTVTIDMRQVSQHPELLDRTLKTLDTTVPCMALMRRSSRDFGALQGVALIRAETANPNELTIVFANDGFLRLADNVLRDSVDGVKLVMSAEDPTPMPDAWWANSEHQMMTSVTAMPGVKDVDAYQEHGVAEASFMCDNADTSQRIKALVNDNLGKFRTSFLPVALPPKPAPKPTPAP